MGRIDAHVPGGTMSRQVTFDGNQRPEPPTDDPTVEDFGVYFDESFGSLCRAIFLVVGDRSEAEDLAQESMVRVYDRWRRAPDIKSLDAYAYSVAINLWRRRARRNKLFRPLRGLEQTPSRGTDSDLDDRIDLGTAIARLPLAQREALMLTVWLGFTSEEAAGMLGVEPSSIRARVHRAREALRGLLEES